MNISFHHSVFGGLFWLEIHCGLERSLLGGSFLCWTTCFWKKKCLGLLMFSELKRHTNKTILCWSECLELTVANLRVASWRLSWARRLGLPSCNSLFRALARAARISPSPASLRFKDDTCLGPASWWPYLENTELLKEGKLCTVPGCLEAAGPRAA